MLTRELKQDYHINLPNPLAEFGTVAMSIYNALYGIKNSVEKEIFNKHSPISIDEYIKHFNDAYDRFCEIVLTSEQLRVRDQSILSNNGLKNWNHYKRFVTNKHSLSDNLIHYNYNSFSIKDEIYTQIHPLVRTIFNIEEQCIGPVKEIWKELLSTYPIKNQSIGRPYFYLVKSLHNWRNDTYSEDTKEFLNKRVATSASLISNLHTYTFSGKSSNFGIVYSPNSEIIASYFEDCYLYETVNGEISIPSEKTLTHSATDVCCIYKDKTNKAYSNTACKIDTPHNLLRQGKHSYNEIVLNSLASEPTAVYCFTHNGYAPSPCIEKATALANRLNLPLITLETALSRNATNDSKNMQNITK